MALWVAVLLMVALDQGPQPGPRQTPRVQVDTWVLHTVKRALIGAKARLERAECQRVLTDFQDAQGRPLLEILEATSLRASEYLFERVWFVDGGDSPHCHRDDLTRAFTVPGSKVVRICTNRFAKYERQSRSGELIVIHEMLHTLGLPENPPTSRQITAQVTRRCGGS